MLSKVGNSCKLMKPYCKVLPFVLKYTSARPFTCSFSNTLNEIKSNMTMSSF